MNLITSNIQTMSSREIAELTGKRHTDVMRDVRNMYGQIGESISASAYSDAQGKERRHYQLDHDMTLLLVSGYSVPLRLKIIKRWSELEQKEQFQIPQTLPEALQLAADLALKIEQDKPKIEYHDRVLSADNGITTTEVASELGMSAIKLNRLLESMKVQRRVGGRWVLTASHLDQGLTVEVTHVDDGGKSRHSMKWREKGRKLIHELVKG